MRKLKVLGALLCLIHGMLYPQQDRRFIFDNFSKRDGLSNNYVKLFYQDKRGIIWIATEQSLDRFDGYSFKNFRSISGSDISFQKNQINCFSDLPGEDGFLIGTTNGVIRFDAHKQHFSYFILEGSEVFNLYIDHQNFIWICSDMGLFKFEPENMDQQPVRVISETIYCITQDHDNNFIIANEEDIFLANKENFEFSIILSNKFARYLFIDSRNQLWYGAQQNGFGVIDFQHDLLPTEYTISNELFKSNYFQGIIEPVEGMIYIVVRDDGLFIYDLDKETFEKHTSRINDPHSLSSNALTSIFKDSFDNIWIGTYNKGFSFLDKWKKPLRHYKFSAEEKGIKSNNVRAIYQDRDDRIWIGTKDGGCLSEFLIDENEFIHYCKQMTDKQSISDDYIFSICDAQPGFLWIGTYRNGLNLFNKQTGKFTHYLADKAFGNSLRSNSIYVLETDANHNLFIGTVGHGMDYLEFGSYRFQHFLPKPGNSKSIAGYAIRDFYLKDDTLLYIATLDGLSIFNTLQKEFTTYYADTSKPYSLPSNILNCVIEDENENIWIGTNSGVTVFKQDIFFTFDEDDGLADNVVLGILEDNHNNLWITTSNGLSKFTPPDNLSVNALKRGDDRGFFINFYESDGLQGNDFDRNAYAKLNTGEFLVGGGNGFNLFHPDSIKFNPIIPKILFTELKISNKTAGISANNSPINKHINFVNYLELDYDQRNFSISYTAVNYSTTQKNSYKYKLEGFDKDWINAEDARTASYTNIPFGEYTFKVLASNNDKVWNKSPKEIQIKILPPFWISNIAIAAYSLIFILILYLSRRIIIIRENLKKEIEITRINAETENRLNKAKLELFTNISHELRTPLTLISLPLDEILQLAKDANERIFYPQLQLIKRNVEYIVKNINQILDLRKLDTGNMKINYSNGNLDQILLEVIQSFHPMFIKKKIKYNTKYIEDDHVISFDRDKIEKVFFNLISNAIKYTNTGGYISIEINKSIRNSESVYTIIVSDDGLGIPNEDMEFIFDRFYQVKKHKKRVREGTGIGLSITKAFIELHGGNIEVKSKLDEGTSFSFNIPARDMIPDDLSEVKTFSTEVVIDSFDDYQIEVNPDIEKKEETLLIVEDNEELRNFMKSSLQEFIIIDAEDGVEGLEKAIKNVPDLIITDVMMPEMDGIQLSKKLKENNITNHIPIIILTAKSAPDDQLQGFHSGAIEYIVKPFNMEILRIKIDSLFNYRRGIQERLKTVKDLGTINNLNISRYDIEFLKKCTEIIEEKIFIKKIGVPELCEELAMSKSQLYNKMKAITNKSLGEFIREIKLNIAAKMLLEDRSPIAEVSVLVGFSNRSHFAKCFKDYFGENPSDYVKNKLKERSKHII